MGNRRVAALAVGVCVAIAPMAWGKRAGVDEIRRSVYKIRLVSEEPDFQTPWNARAASTSYGTGFFIGDRRILTNAHVVSNARYLTVQRDGEPRATPARVLFVAHDADLALLTTDGKDDFKGLKALDFGELPRLRSPVSAIGYPLGGEQMSITEGIVSRVDFRVYVHSGVRQHLLVQVDSAINPGNSGGPVIQGEKVVGVAFQSFAAAESTGYIIPVPVVRRFLKDIEDGRYDGHPDDGLTVLADVMSNPHTARFHGLAPTEGGVKVASVAAYAPTHELILPGDIIVAVDGSSIGVDGRVSFQGERVEAGAIFDLKQMGEKVDFTVVRGDERRVITVPVAPSRVAYQPATVFGRHPRYFVYAGLVFESMSRSLLMSFGRQWYRTAPVALRYLHNYAAFDEEWRDAEDVVVLIEVLRHDVNTYAEPQVNGVVATIDGKTVRSLEQARSLLEGDGSEFQVITFAGSSANPVVLSRKDARAAHESILKQYSVSPSAWMSREEALPDAVTREGREVNQ